LYHLLPRLINTKHLFIIPTDAHNYKITGMLKTIKIPTNAPTCFGSRRNHHQGAISCLAKNYNYDSVVLIVNDVVNVMAAYQPVVQVCGTSNLRLISWCNWCKNGTACISFCTHRNQYITWYVVFIEKLIGTACFDGTCNFIAVP
jgi:hypothetical protein